MTGELGALEVVVGVALVVTAGVALWAPRLSAMVAFLSFGVVLTTLWAVMGAPDIALAEAALGTGVTGALFIEAVTRDERRSSTDPSPWWAVVAAGLLALVMIPLAATLSEQSPGGQSSELAEQAIGSTGVEHPITAVLLAFRAYDTLLEIAVLFVAVVVASALTHSPSALTRPHQLLGPFAVRLLPLLVVVAGWVLFAGSSLPGGAFQAGAILAGALVLTRVAGISSTVWRVTRPAAAFGLLCFLAFAAIGLSRGTWLAVPEPIAGALIVSLETALTISIGISLALLVAAVGDAESADAEVAP